MSEFNLPYSYSTVNQKLSPTPSGGAACLARASEIAAEISEQGIGGGK